MLRGDDRSSAPACKDLSTTAPIAADPRPRSIVEPLTHRFRRVPDLAFRPVEPKFYTIEPMIESIKPMFRVIEAPVQGR